MSILQNSQKKMLSNENSETAFFWEIPLPVLWYFFQTSDIKIEFLQEKQTSIWTKESFDIDFLQFFE